MAKTYIDAAAFTNELYKELTGKEDISAAESGGIVSIGTELKNSIPRDNVFDKIVAKVAKTVTEYRDWSVKLGRVFKDSWTLGLMLESLRVRTFEASTDHSKAPVSGNTYDSFTHYVAADVVAKYYNKDCGFQIEYWLPTDQLWTAFTSLEAMDKFLSSIAIAVSNSMKKRVQALIKICLANMIGLTMHKAFPDADYGEDSKPLAVNILHLYNAVHPSATLTAENCRQSQEFLRFAVKTMNNYVDRMTDDVTAQFNIDGEEEQTPAENIQVTMLSTFANDIKYNLYNAPGQFDFSLMQLPGYETVSAWQAIQEYEEGVISEINVTIKDEEGADHNVEATGIMAVIYDIDAVGVNCEQTKVNSFYNPDIDQTKFYDRYRACFINKTDKNFVVFYVADAEE